MTSALEFNPLESIAIPHVGNVQPNGLNLVIGPNSSGKTQLLRDIHGRMIGREKKMVVCDEVKIRRAPSLDDLLETLVGANHYSRTTNANNQVVLEPMLPVFGEGESKWSLVLRQIEKFHADSTNEASAPQTYTRDSFMEHFGRSFVMALFLDRRLTITNTVDNFDYEVRSPSNELQALYVDTDAKRMFAEEAKRVFGKAIWLDNTRANRLCLRVKHGPNLPTPEDRLEPGKMRNYRLIEDEGDGFKSYMAICLTLLLGQRPVVLIDEPEMCLHPPQAYALGRFIGRHGVSKDRATFVATHSSHVLRGIIEETEQLEVIRLSRSGEQFVGRRVSKEILKASIERPSTRSETILDGLFAEAVTVVESEGDRLVYGTTWDRVSSEFKHDIHFVSVGGLGGVADPCALYRNLKIPVCIAVDLDVIRELGTFEAILNAIASNGAASKLIEEAKKILQEVKKLGPLHNETETHERIAEIADEVLDWKDTSQLKRIRSTLQKLCAGLSDTGRLKKGVEHFRNEGVFGNLEAFILECRSVGVFLVPVGELEDWLGDSTPDAPSKTKKPEWANYAAGVIREVETKPSDVWQFIRQIASYQRDEIKRLSGYV